MTREVQVIAWCDACAAEIGAGSGDVERATDELHIAASVGPLRPGPKARTRLLDLCDRHAKTLWLPLAELLAEYGSDDEAPARPARPHRPGGKRVPVPGSERPWVCLCGVDYAGDAALRGHFSAAHFSKRHHTIGSVFGDICPLCEAKSGRLGIHVAKAHPELANLTQAFVAADSSGDPHGIVAKQRGELLGR